MKTIIEISGKCLIVMAFLLFANNEKTYSQKGGWIHKSKYSYGLQIDQTLNGCGHGMLTGIDLFFNTGNAEVNAGIFSQTNYKNLAGISLNYKQFITFEEYSNIYFHYTFMYHSNNYLSNSLNEINHPNDYIRDYKYEKFNTTSSFIGVGLEAMTLRNLFLDIKVGIGGYISNVHGEDLRNKNVEGRDDNGFAFMTSIGMKYQFNAKTKISKFRR